MNEIGSKLKVFESSCFSSTRREQSVLIVVNKFLTHLTITGPVGITVDGIDLEPSMLHLFPYNPRIQSHPVNFPSLELQ